MHKPAQKILAPIILMIACTSFMAQQRSDVFGKIENSIRENESNWTLMMKDRWSGPTGQSIMYLWRLDQHEIFIIVIQERSTAEAVKYFQDDGLGRAAVKTARVSLDIGDECYLRQTGPNTARE